MTPTPSSKITGITSSLFLISQLNPVSHSHSPAQPGGRSEPIPGGRVHSSRLPILLPAKVCSECGTAPETNRKFCAVPPGLLNTAHRPTERLSHHFFLLFVHRHAVELNKYVAAHVFYALVGGSSILCEREKPNSQIFAVQSMNLSQSQWIVTCRLV